MIPMKRFRLLLSVLVALMSGVSAFAQAGKCLPARTDGVAPYVPGENLQFNISYNWHAVQTDVAKGTLFVKQENLNGEKVWHTGMHLKTAPFFDAFFKIREEFDSWFALKGVEPRKFHRDSREGNYHAVNHYLYDRKAGVIHATLEYYDKDQKSKDIPYGDCTYDVTTLFYYVRQMDFSSLRPGTLYRISFAIDDEVNLLKLTYRGQENKYVKGLGTIATRKFSIAVNKGEVFDGGEDAVIWFSDDDNRIPVAFMAPLKVGAMNGRLCSYSGLAHDFSAFLSKKKVK